MTADAVGTGLSSRAAGMAAGLRAWPRRRIALLDLWRILDQADPASRASARRRVLLADALSELADAGLLDLPSDRSYDRTEAPPLPGFVTVPGNEAAEAPCRPVPWHPALAWAPETRLTRVQRDLLVQVNRWLRTHRDDLVVPMRERSVDVFGHEKTLDRLVGTALFGPGRLTLDLLCCRRVAPRFHAEPVGDGGLLLVVENSDTFDSLVRVLADTTGHRVGLVGWGAGAGFEASVVSLPRLGRPVDDVAYFGDLDEKGLRIPVNAAALAAREGLPPVRPAIGLYAALLARAHPQPSTTVSDRTATHLVTWLSAEHRDQAAAHLHAGERLAQEAVGLAYLTRSTEWLSGLT